MTLVRRNKARVFYKARTYFANFYSSEVATYIFLFVFFLFQTVALTRPAIICAIPRVTRYRRGNEEKEDAESVRNRQRRRDTDVGSLRE